MTAIVASIGNNHESLARIFGVSHLRQSRVNRVQHGGQTIGLRVLQRALDVVSMRREPDGYSCQVGELYEECLVLFVERVEQLRRRLARGSNLVAHAAALIEQD